MGTEQTANKYGGTARGELVSLELRSRNGWRRNTKRGATGGIGYRRRQPTGWRWSAKKYRAIIGPVTESVQKYQWAAYELGSGAAASRAAAEPERCRQIAAWRK